MRPFGTAPMERSRWILALGPSFWAGCFAASFFQPGAWPWALAAAGAGLFLLARRAGRKGFAGLMLCAAALGLLRGSDPIVMHPGDLIDAAAELALSMAGDYALAEPARLRAEGAGAAEAILAGLRALHAAFQSADGLAAQDRMLRFIYDAEESYRRGLATGLIA